MFKFTPKARFENGRFSTVNLSQGQSGHPMSPYYRDQQHYWLKCLPMPLAAGKPAHQLLLKPDGN